MFSPRTSSPPLGERRVDTIKGSRHRPSGGQHGNGQSQSDRSSLQLQQGRRRHGAAPPHARGGQTVGVCRGDLGDQLPQTCLRLGELRTLQWRDVHLATAYTCADRAITASRCSVDPRTVSLAKSPSPGTQPRRYKACRTAPSMNWVSSAARADLLSRTSSARACSSALKRRACMSTCTRTPRPSDPGAAVEVTLCSVAAPAWPRQRSPARSHRTGQRAAAPHRRQRLRTPRQPRPHQQTSRSLPHKAARPPTLPRWPMRRPRAPKPKNDPRIPSASRFLVGGTGFEPATSAE